MNIRPITAEDLPRLRAIIDSTGLFPSEMLNPMFDEHPWLACCIDGVPVGLVYYAPERMTSGTWNLLLIAVHRDQQGRGIGAALMRHAEQDLAARDARVLLVETSGLPEFERTRQFYKGLGYAEEARIRDFYNQGEDKVVFWKSLRA